MDRRMLYVAFSRATSANGLFINGQYKPCNENKNDKAAIEMLRLRKESPVKLCLKFPEDCTKGPNNFLFLYQNVRSLNKNFNVIKSNISLTSCDILSFVETWTLAKDNFNIPDYTILQRQDCPGNVRKAFGNITYVKSLLINKVKSFYHCVNKEGNNYMITSGLIIQNYCIITIYKSPKFTFTNFKNNINKVYQAIEKENVVYIIIIGDFNMNILNEKNNLSKNLLEFMKSKNLHLVVDNNSITTDNNTLIDLCFSNNQNIIINIFESIYSDHKPLWLQITG